jgi:DNA adenine methylase
VTLAVPTRPLVRWHGGKWKIAPWVIAHFPKHACYTEVFGGGASVLLRKPPARAELYNDMDDTIVALFRILRDRTSAQELIRLLHLTPFAREEFHAAYERSDDPIEDARRTIVRSFMGYGSDGTAGTYRTGFRSTVTSTLKLPASEWATYPLALQAIVERLQCVVIDNRPAIPLLRQVDAAHTLHYLDPPYLPSTRSSGNRRRGQGYHVYEHELTEEDHVELLAVLQDLEGMVVLSGYPSELYDGTLTGWRSVQRQAYADGGRARVECLWLNPATVAALEHGPLFAL